MGDPLSVASGIAGLLSIAGLVFSRTYKFVKAAKEADSSIQKLSNEIRTLSGILQSLSLVAIELETGPVDSAFQLHHVISCQQVLLKIERSTREADPADAGDNKARSFMKKLKWPFTSAETMELIAEITRHQRLITVALSADSIIHLQKLLSGQDEIRKDIKDMRNEFDRQRELATRISMDKERKKVLDFFGGVNPSTNHETSRGLRHRQTGLWLLSNEKFFAWVNTSGSRLWLSGIPGAGKTVLASVIIEEMMKQSTPEEAIAYFYCDYKDEQRQQLPNILGAIACQLARQDESQRSFALLQDYYTACHPHDRPASSPKTSKLLEVIQNMSSCFDEVSIVVDALDECGNNRTEVVESLAGLNHRALSSIRMAFLSRDELDIRMILEDFMHIPIAAHSEDLEIFVFEEIEARIRKKKLRIKNPALKNDIIEKLIHGADGMFRWAACQIDYLCTLPHDRARREALASLPPDLNSTYERILDRVAKQPLSTQRIVRDTLMWTIYADPPLSIEELCEALSVDESTTHLDADSRPDEEDILKYCSSLLREAVSGDHLELAHFTVQEYLCSDTLRGHQELAFFYADPEKATEHMSRICLAYLNCKDFSRLPVQDYEEWQAFTCKHPFHPLASRKWTTFASNHWNDQVIKEQAQVLFHPRKSLQFLNWAQGAALTGSSNPKAHFSTMTSAVTTDGISTLHLAAIHQLEWVVKWLLEEKVDTNQLSMIGTPLHCALLGYEAIAGQVESLNLDMVGAIKRNTMLEHLSAFGADPTLLYRDHDDKHRNALEICIRSYRAHELFELFPKMSACLNRQCLRFLEGQVSHGEFEIAQGVIGSVERQQLDPTLKLRTDSLARTLELSIKSPGLNPTTNLRGKGETSMSIAEAVRLDKVDVLEDLLNVSPECVNGAVLDEGTRMWKSSNFYLIKAQTLPKSTTKEEHFGIWLQFRTMSQHSTFCFNKAQRLPAAFQMWTTEG
ncbi:hypothetical protein SLS58_005734 [Diplodia intermedia]|uniref:Ankyrin repeat protein n=1 Tax=Diplodia intermedia TaxID=856260 RepID=A0ABR3TQA4_9PEZI